METSASADAAAARDDWRALSACLGEDPELFFPLSPHGPGEAQITAAKEICARCLVRAQCLGFAQRSGQEFGIWGGLTEEERGALRAPAAPARWRISARRASPALSSARC